MHINLIAKAFGIISFISYPKDLWRNFQSSELLFPNHKNILGYTVMQKTLKKSYISTNPMHINPIASAFKIISFVSHPKDLWRNFQSSELLLTNHKNILGYPVV
jgi:hypothetical protein